MPSATSRRGQTGVHRGLFDVAVRVALAHAETRDEQELRAGDYPAVVQPPLERAGLIARVRARSADASGAGRTAASSSGCAVITPARMRWRGSAVSSVSRSIAEEENSAAVDRGDGGSAAGYHHGVGFLRRDYRGYVLRRGCARKTAEMRPPRARDFIASTSPSQSSRPPAGGILPFPVLSLHHLRKSLYIIFGLYSP